MLNRHKKEIKSQNMVPPKKTLFYGWYMVIVGLVILTLNALAVFRGIGVLVVVLQKNFSWSRTEISIGNVLSRAEGAALGPIEGFLIDKIGAKRMILIGMIIMGVGFFAFSRIQNVWQFYIVFMIITLGAGLGGWLAVASVLNNWFIRNRTMAMAIAMSGIHLAGIFLPLYAYAIDWQFRFTLVAMGVIIILVGIPSYLLTRNTPEEVGLLPDGEASLDHGFGVDADNQNTPKEFDFTLKQALSAPVFWVITASHVSSTMALATMGVHLTPRITDMMIDLGREESVALYWASFVESGYAIFAFPAIFISGWLGDRMSKKNLLIVFMFMQGVSTLILAYANTLWMAFVFAFIYGISFGGRVPIMSAIRGEYFGRKAFASITGWSMLPNGVLMAISPVVTAWWYDTTGSYFLPFFILSVITLIGGVIMFFAKPPNRLIPQDIGEK